MNNMKKEQEEQESQLENKEVYIDANLLIDSVISIDEKGEKARGFIEKIKKGDYKAYTSTLTLDEVMWIVQNEKNHETAYESAKTITDIPNLNFISVSREIIMKALEIYKTEKIHLAAMKEKDITTIVSKDPDFNKIKGIEIIDFTK